PAKRRQWQEKRAEKGAPRNRCFVGRGCARERSEHSPSGGCERSGLCTDESGAIGGPGRDRESLCRDGVGAATGGGEVSSSVYAGPCHLFQKFSKIFSSGAYNNI